jgi:hypothetical protein
MDGPVEITPAADAGQAWTVTQVDNVWPVRKDAVAVDPSTGTVTDHVHWAGLVHAGRQVARRA